jgi:hypothetical protein
MFRRPSCGLTSLVRVTIPRLSARHDSQDFRFSANENVAMLSSVLTTNRKQVEPSKHTLRTPGQEVVVVMSTIRVDQQQHVEPVSQAGRRNSTWKICRRPVCFGGEAGPLRAQRRVLQPSSGEDAGIRALLSRVGACRAEGGCRFARVCSCRSALPTPTNTDLREARVLYGGIRAVGCYAGQTLLLCKEDPTA